MLEKNKKVQAIKNMVIRGMVLNSEILPRLYQADMNHINPDDIVKMSIKYKYGNRVGCPKIIIILKFYFYLFCASIFSFAFGMISMETELNKIFIGTLLENELPKFGDKILFWLGLKKVGITGFDMLNAAVKTYTSTFKVISSFLLGFFIGFIIFIFCTQFIKFIYKRKKIQIDINRLLRRSSQSR